MANKREGLMGCVIMRMNELRVYYLIGCASLNEPINAEADAWGPQECAPSRCSAAIRGDPSLRAFTKEAVP